MSNTGLKVFDTTLQETHHWLHIVMEELETDNRRLAFTALRSGLHAIRDRIGAPNAVHFGAQLPMLLRGAFYEGWRPFTTPTRERTLDDFILHIESNLPANSEVEPWAVARATATAIAECLDPGEVDKVINMLPMEIRQLWPDYVKQAELAFGS